jgi:hypothetical protein
MRRIAALSSLLLILLRPAAARCDEKEAESGQRQPESYESPILSLLLLPVNLLIKMASLLGADESPSNDGSDGAPKSSPK